MKTPYTLAEDAVKEIEGYIPPLFRGYISVQLRKEMTSIAMRHIEQAVKLAIESPTFFLEAYKACSICGSKMHLAEDYHTDTMKAHANANQK